MNKQSSLALGAFLIVLTFAPSAFAQDLGSMVGGILKRAASDILKDPNAQLILEVPTEQAEEIRKTIPVSSALYDPQDKKKTYLKNLFATAPRPSWDAFVPTSVLRTKDIGYPRLAIRFLRYGPDLPCWTIEANIWISKKLPIQERGEVCRGPIWMKDALGQPASMISIDVSTLSDQVKSGASMLSNKFANTGEVRTEGPLPPAKPFGYVLSDPELSRALDDVIARLSIHTGYRKTYDENLEPDQRFWGADFDPAGLVKSTRKRNLVGQFEDSPDFTSQPPF